MNPFIKKFLLFIFFLVVFFTFSFPVNAQVECSEGEIESLYVFTPLTIDRASPGNLRVISLPEKFRNQRLWFQFANTDDSLLLPDTHLIPIDIDSDGNGQTQISASNLNQTNNTELAVYSVSLRGGPFTRQSSSGAYYEDYPLCFQSDLTVSIIGTGERCLNLGDECIPGGDNNPCEFAIYGYCDDTQSPARWRLPELDPVILNDANCEYLPTPGDATCAQANGNLIFACDREIVMRPTGADSTVAPVEHTRCCFSAAQCDLSFGRDDETSSDTAPYDICATNLDPSSEAFTNCINCSGIWTAVGCIGGDPRSMVGKFITIGTGIVGGIFLLRILAAAFMLTTSQGDVKKTSEAKEMITEAIVGVIVIIMSVSLIQFVGSDILKIPGFGS